MKERNALAGSSRNLLHRVPPVPPPVFDPLVELFAIPHQLADMVQYRE